MMTAMVGPLDPHYWQTILDLIPFPIYVVDVHNLQVIAANRQMRERAQVSDGAPCHKAIYQLDERCSFCRIGELTASDTGRQQVVFEHFNEADDRWYQLQETMISWFDGRKAKYSIGVDITSLKEVQNSLAEAHVRITLQNQELERLSVTDRLTGLGNRRKLDAAFVQEFDRSLRYRQPLSLVITDVDKFKMVNDQFGHQAGDLVLVTIADILRRTVRRTDVLGRWGGEEFMVICPNTNTLGAAALAEHLREAISRQDITLVGRKTCSFGVAEWDGKESLDTWAARADAALYRAKENGRNRVEVAVADAASA